jgi:hypothetical protein
MHTSFGQLASFGDIGHLGASEARSGSRSTRVSITLRDGRGSEVDVPIAYRGLISTAQEVAKSAEARRSNESAANYRQRLAQYANSNFGPLSLGNAGAVADIVIDAYANLRRGTRTARPSGPTGIRTDTTAIKTTGPTFSTASVLDALRTSGRMDAPGASDVPMTFADEEDEEAYYEAVAQTQPNRTGLYLVIGGVVVATGVAAYLLTRKPRK